MHLMTAFFAVEHCTGAVVAGGMMAAGTSLGGITRIYIDYRFSEGLRFVGEEELELVEWPGGQSFVHLPTAARGTDSLQVFQHEGFTSAMDYGFGGTMVDIPVEPLLLAAHAL